MTASTITTHRQALATFDVAESICSAVHSGRATAVSQISFQADSNSRMGSSCTG
jgi:hypothetical protein